eukprot:1617932-Amphidinium_carterae.1
MEYMATVTGCYFALDLVTMMIRLDGRQDEGCPPKTKGDLYNTADKAHVCKLLSRGIRRPGDQGWSQQPEKAGSQRDHASYAVCPGACWYSGVVRCSSKKQAPAS